VRSSRTGLRVAARAAVVAVAGMLLVSSCSRDGAGSPSGGWVASGSVRPSGPPATVTLVAAGDIACDPAMKDYTGVGTPRACQQRATADLVGALHPDVVAPLGDDQYDDGTLAAFRASYDPTWGRFKAISRPAPGNHEYPTAGAAGYFAYFGAAAGTPGQGWYSYDLGAWHVVVLNANCGNEIRCDHASPQLSWLRADLRAHRGGCLLAYWHQPRWEHGEYQGDKKVAPFVEALFTAEVDLVLNGHDHNYERYQPRDPDGTVDPAHGLREIVVGTGGRSHYPVVKDPEAAVVDDTSFGVLKVTLRPTSYDWQFVPVPGDPFTDSGSATCHRPARTG